MLFTSGIVDVVGMRADSRLGKHEEDKFRMAIQRKPRIGKARSIHFTLKGGRKVSARFTFKFACQNVGLWLITDD